ncbi:MAG: riboflavin synthase [Chloroflexota bacterium]|nr:riboflavin synthase [Chloroflexota bacterium]
MFTGIVEEVGRVASAQADKLTITAGLVVQGLEIGGSVAVNGVCLTATSVNDRASSVDIMDETLKRTNLGRLKAGDEVNLERPMTLAKPLGGHLVQGHIDGTGKIVSISAEGEAILIRIEAPPEVMRYIVPKGFIAVDGISLTMVDFQSDSFRVSIVGYTRAHTTLGRRRVGDLVNLEADIIGKYVERFQQVQRPDITVDFLSGHGFTVS